MQLSRIFTVPGQEKPQLSAVSFLKGTFSGHCEIREGSLTALYCLVMSLPCSDKVIQYTYIHIIPHLMVFRDSRAQMSEMGLLPW